jgi:hypothetical protein
MSMANNFFVCIYRVVGVCLVVIFINFVILDGQFSVYEVVCGWKFVLYYVHCAVLRGVFFITWLFPYVLTARFSARRSRAHHTQSTLKVLSCACTARGAHIDCSGSCIHNK